MSVVWNEIHDDNLFSTPPGTELYQVGGFFVSPLMSSGDSYDLYQDIQSTPPSFFSGSITYSLTVARVCTQIVNAPPLTNVFKGFPPRRDYGILTIGANPAYIVGRKFIEYPFQFHGNYDPLVGTTFPDAVRQITFESSGSRDVHDHVYPGTRAPAGSVFSLYSDYQDLTLRVRGAIVINPAPEKFVLIHKFGV